MTNHYTHYYVVTAKSNQELHDQVEGLINQEGWDLHGGIAIAISIQGNNGHPALIYAQALTKVEAFPPDAHSGHPGEQHTQAVH